MKAANYFMEVCCLIEEGFTISQALDELEIDSATFYKMITKDQRLTLDQLRTANKLYGSRGNDKGGEDVKELHEYFTSNDYAI